MRQPKERPIRWPKRWSPAALKRMSTRSQLAYARDLHDAWAEQHRRDMEWDLFWAQLYRELMSGKKAA